MEGKQPDWLRALSAVARHWRWSGSFAAIVILAASVAAFLMSPIYEPIARIEIDPPGAELFSLQGGESRLEYLAEYLETQAKALQSDELAIQVIRKLQLDQNRDFVGKPRHFDPLTDPEPPESANSQLMPVLTPPEYQSLGVFRPSLNVRRDTGSHLINVSFAAHDPRLAALVANTVVEQFIQTSYKTRHDAILQSIEWLSRQLDDILAKVKQSNLALAEFQTASGISPLSGHESTLGDKMADLNRQLVAIQGERIQMQSLLESVESAHFASTPQTIADPVIQELSKHLATARAGLSEALVVYGKNHPNAKKLRAQVDGLEAEFTNQENTVLNALRTSYEAANTRERLLSAAMNDTSKQMTQMAQYDLLKKEAEVNENLYQTLYAKVKEAGITAESRSSNIRWIDRARVLDAPTRPHRGLTIAASIALGIFGGIMLAFVRANFDRSVQTPEDVSNWTGISRISMIPMIGRRELNNPVRHGLGLRPRTQTHELPHTVLLNRPRSAESEAFWGLHTSVRLWQPERPPQVLLIASPFASEGKTTIAINLATMLARDGNTCIVDADLRRGGMTTWFEMSDNRGLSDVLIGSANLEDTLCAVSGVPTNIQVPTEVNLTLLPAGQEVPNPGGLICSDEMRKIIQQLRQRFDFVIIDTPPILLVADAWAISPLADGVLLVSRSGVTPRESMRRSIEMLAEVNSAPVLAVVLNGAHLDSSKYRSYYA
jgi:capsular exopolysaccharide synthesis family protein